MIEIFTEVIVAPDYDEAALEVLRSKKNLRVLRVWPDSREQAFNTNRSVAACRTDQRYAQT